MLILLVVLRAEIRHLKDSNKAMSLYINEIIGRLLQTKGFEHVLEKDVNKTLPMPPIQISAKRQGSAPMNVESTSRRNFSPETPMHKRISSEASYSASGGIGGGLSRAFSFRKKPEIANTIPNLRPLKLVEEQHPQPALKSDGTLSHSRARMYSADDSEIETSESKAAKRASWVPGWFGKTGAMTLDDK
jgi:hypothetical protein